VNVILPRDSGHWPARGKWVLVRTPLTARVGCADCGQTAPISFHDIDADGNVTPSLDCGIDECGWHANVTLQGWKEAIA